MLDRSISHHARRPRYFERFQAVFGWALEHLVDTKHGEWYGYTTRDGEVTHRFKGGPYKGCFHVPRALLMSLRLLQSAAAKLRAA
jgi:N-acylglucosamine 2-epimerase